MYFKKDGNFFQLILVVIPLFSVVSSHTIRYSKGICPELTRQYCACNGTGMAKIVPMKMCFDVNECKPCPMELQDHVDCSTCPGNTCPVCSENEFSLREIEKKKSANVKTLFTRSARKSRKAWDPFSHELWCKKLNILNGQVECTISWNSKECLLLCYEPFTVGGQRELTFACKRKENVWKPEMQDCAYNSGGYNVTEVPKEFEEPQQHSMPNAPEMKANDHGSHFHSRDNRGAGKEEAPVDDEYTYDSDDDGQVAESGKENTFVAHTSKAPHRHERSNDKIGEGDLKEFYDLLYSEK